MHLVCLVLLTFYFELSGLSFLPPSLASSLPFLPSFETVGVAVTFLSYGLTQRRRGREGSEIHTHTSNNFLDTWMSQEHLKLYIAPTTFWTASPYPFLPIIFLISVNDISINSYSGWQPWNPPWSFFFNLYIHITGWSYRLYFQEHVQNLTSSRHLPCFNWYKLPLSLTWIISIPT